MSAWKAGKVQWFDDLTGEGMITDTGDGNTYYVHYSAIESKKKRKTLKKGGKVKFKLYINRYLKQVDKVQEVR